MAYNENLDERISQVVGKWKGIERKKMFGGVCYLLNGNMFCGVYQDYLILRLGDEAAAEALKVPSVQEFDITGRPMKGWVMVEGAAIEGSELEKWVIGARLFAETLPKK